ncbi:MAG: hypothetical protein BWY47_01862 [Bacteroidetes bacterium ADurb.Bin302]|nr:MAG: hypothetical protein BWY47_01862 [Bacteroidetes bacterium ADurb.Bin302]
MVGNVVVPLVSSTLYDVVFGLKPTKDTPSNKILFNVDTFA